MKPFEFDSDAFATWLREAPAAARKYAVDYTDFASQPDYFQETEHRLVRRSADNEL
jgi:hypothetical protein